MTPKLQETMVYLSGAARFAMTEYTSGHVWSRLAFKFITFQTVIVCPNNWIVIFAYLIISANHSYYNQSFHPRMHTYHRNLRAPGLLLDNDGFLTPKALFLGGVEAGYP